MLRPPPGRCQSPLFQWLTRLRALNAAGRAEARPLEPPGHRSPLNYYVPGVCVTGVDVTLPTTWTGRGPEGPRVAGLSTEALGSSWRSAGRQRVAAAGPRAVSLTSIRAGRSSCRWHREVPRARPPARSSGWHGPRGARLRERRTGHATTHPARGTCAGARAAAAPRERAALAVHRRMRYDIVRGPTMHQIAVAGPPPTFSIRCGHDVSNAIGSRGPSSCCATRIRPTRGRTRGWRGAPRSAPTPRRRLSARRPIPRSSRTLRRRWPMSGGSGSMPRWRCCGAPSCIPSTVAEHLRGDAAARRMHPATRLWAPRAAPAQHRRSAGARRARPARRAAAPNCPTARAGEALACAQAWSPRRGLGLARRGDVVEHALHAPVGRRQRKRVRPGC
jgi:hypothetical protein